MDAPIHFDGPRSSVQRWFDPVALGVVALLVAIQLFVPPVLSVANDHDFEKILGRQCLGPVATHGPAYFDYAVLRFSYDPDSCIDWPMRTTNEAAFRVGLWLDHQFYSKADFDLRFMGAVYGLIFLAGFAQFQRALRLVPQRLSMTAQIAWMVVTCNAVYIPLFNTLYFDALTLATITGAMASIALVHFRREPTPGAVLLASIWLAVLAGSKGQHAIMALIFLPLLLRRGAIAARAAGAVLVFAGACLSLGTMPRFYQGEATFNALFYRILPAIPEPAAYLKETRIPVSWAQYTGEVAFAEDVPLRDPFYEEQFGNWFGAVELIRLYARHPSAAWLIARENLDEASMDRVRIRMAGVPHKLGNYEESTGRSPQAVSHFFTVWAAIKDALFGANPVLYLVFILAVIAAGWILAPTSFRPLLAAVTASLCAEFAICMLDGADGGRHLTLFCYLLDLLVCADVVFAVRRLKSSGTERSPS